VIEAAAVLAGRVFELCLQEGVQLCLHEGVQLCLQEEVQIVVLML
jgi:hypothetical protein